MQTKICIKCSILQSIDNFYSGRSDCKTCVSKKSKEKYATDINFKNKKKDNARKRKESGLNKTQYIEVKCDFQVSEFCKKDCIVGKYGYSRNVKINDGKYRCKYCAIFETHEGSKSHYFKYKKDDEFFDKIDTELKAYLLGIIAGDGHVTRKEVSVVAHKIDINTLMLFNNVVNGINILSKGENCLQVNITSKKIASDVRKHLKIKAGKKSNLITLPDLPDNLMWHFIRGLVDTDGCVDNPFTSKYSPRCYYSSTSTVILNEVLMFCKNKNINGYLTGIKVCFVARAAHAFMDKIYSNASFYLPRKHAFYTVWNTWEPFKGTVIRPSKRELKKRKKENE